MGEHWGVSLRDLAVQAVLAALEDAHVQAPEALFVGNMLSGQLSGQQNLGALIADYAGLRGIEAIKVESACASGSAAFRMAYIAVAGGLCDVALVCGVEKMTDASPDLVTAALATAADALYESEQGLSFVALNALLMQRYMHEYGYTHDDFCGFSINAHRNAVNNPNAMFRRPITQRAYAEAKMIASPVSLFDSSGIADGAAAAVLMPTEMAEHQGLIAIRIAASALATDSVALHDRQDLLGLQAARTSAQKAYRQAGLGADQIDFFELHDAFTIMAALSLEAAEFAARGEGVRLAVEDEISLAGRIPICTMGGLKARGHPVGATGMYQIAEAVTQLRGEAGANQLAGARVGMTQNIGGSGAAVCTHIFQFLD